MSGFQRFVTYINLYEENTKIRSVGFARVEQQNEQCRMEIHMRGTGYTGISCPVHLFVRKDGKMVGIPIGKLQVTSGVGDGRFLMESGNLGGSGHDLSQIGGFLIFVNERVMFASQWDEKEILREQFMSVDDWKAAELKKVQEQKEAEEQKTEEARRRTRNANQQRSSGFQRSFQVPGQRTLPVNPQTVNKDTSAGNPAPQPVKAESHHQKEEHSQPEEHIHEAKTGNEPEEHIHEAKPTQASDIHAAEAVVKPTQASDIHAAEAAAQPVQQEEAWALKWQFILENYPVLTPFEGENDILCVRLELKDLKLLPKHHWYLGNNSFLLHGFFNYRYLILGAIEQEGKKRWFLGIPGIFQSQEKVMAAIFGFTEYKSEKTAEQKTGQFGYWYRFLE